jgi:alpha/beta superfamily hydrolase
METSRNMIQRWHDYQPTKKQTFWIALGCIIATLVIGFGFGGWVTGGTAQAMATQAAQESRLELAAAVCAEDFMGAADARERLAKLKNVEWYERDDLVAESGWATMPGESDANSAVAAMCATRLAESAETVG